MAGFKAADNITGWIKTGIGWIKKGFRRGKISKIDNAINKHDADSVDKLVRNVEKKRKNRTESS